METWGQLHLVGFGRGQLLKLSGVVPNYCGGVQLREVPVFLGDRFGNARSRRERLKKGKR